MAKHYIKRALYKYLVDDTDVGGVLGNRIYNGLYKSPGTVPQYPYLVFNLVSGNNEKFAFNRTKTGRPRISISVYGDSDDDATCAIVREKLRDFSGAMAGLATVDYSEITAEREIYDQENSTWMHGFDWLPVYEEET